MSIFAGVIAVKGFITLVTMIDVPAQHLGSALFDSPHGLPVAAWHAITKFCSIVRPVATKDIGHLNHGKSAINWSRVWAV
jgi:hypothetical protein